MKKILLILSLFIYSFANADCNSAIQTAKNYVDTYIVPNGQNAITGQRANAALNYIITALKCVDTISDLSFTKNSTRDSFVIVYKGVRFAVKDSIGIGGGGGSQTLSISNDTLTISNGNSVILPIYFQSDSATITSYDVLNSQNAPPISPNTGDTYLVGTSPSGAWVGHAKDIAEWNGSSWDFTDGVQGDFLYNATTALTYIFRSGNWVQTTGIPALNKGNNISTGLTLGTRNNKDFNFISNNIIRGVFLSNGSFRVVNQGLSGNILLGANNLGIQKKIYLGGGLSLSNDTLVSSGGGDLATLIDDCQNVDAETIDGFETFPILKNDTVYQLSLGTFAELIGGGGGGISDAPSDGQLYGRQNNDWSVFPDAELPSTDHYEFFADTLCEGICSEYVGIKRKGSYSSYRTDFGFVSTYNSLSNKGYVSMGAANSSIIIDDNNDVQINAQGKLRLLTPNYNTSSNGSVLTLIDSMNGECEWKPQYATVPISASDTGVKGQMAVDATYLYICVDTDTWTRVALAW